MTYKIMNIFLLCILLISISDIVTAQELEDDWYIGTEYETIYIGETFLVNVSGPGNTTFTIKFMSLDGINNTFQRVYKTNKTGNWSRDFPSLREEQEGMYSIRLIVDGILRGSRLIEVIYHEDQAQWIAINDGVLRDDMQDIDDARQDKELKRQNNYLKKWIAWFFIPVFSVFTFFMMVVLISTWPVIRLWYYKDKKEISDSKRARWTLEFLTGGKPSEDFSEEFPGSIRDDGDGVFEPDDPRVTDDAHGLTEEQLEKTRRESHYGKDWKEKVPYGSVSDDEFYYPKTLGYMFWLILSLFITSLSILILAIWFYWYILSPVGIIIMLIVIFLYFKYIKTKTNIDETNIIENDLEDLLTEE